jgi:F-type H+-transporting ATPase subunit a
MESVQNFFRNFGEKFKAWIDANPRRAAIWAAAIVLFVIGLFLPVDSPHVALSGEALFSDGPAWFTNSLLTTFIVDIILIVAAVLATSRMSLVPKGWQNFMEMVVEYLYNLSESVAGARARQFFPWVATLFFFVLISNYTGLIPGVGSIGYYHEEEHASGGSSVAITQNVGAADTAVAEQQLSMTNGNLTFQPIANVIAPIPPTEEEHEEGAEGAVIEEEHHAVFVPLFRAPSADLNMTFALAITTVLAVQYWGVRALGGGYFKKFINTSGTGMMKGINIFVGVLEIISELSRILAFGFRLFGNIFAGEIVLATMAFLVAFFLPLPFYVLEVFVGLVQAVVFMMLALVFFTMATISHEHHDEHETHEVHRTEVGPQDTPEPIPSTTGSAGARVGVH